MARRTWGREYAGADDTQSILAVHKQSVDQVVYQIPSLYAAHCLQSTFHIFQYYFNRNHRNTKKYSLSGHRHLAFQQTNHLAETAESAGERCAAHWKLGHSGWVFTHYDVHPLSIRWPSATYLHAPQIVVHFLKLQIYSSNTILNYFINNNLLITYSNYVKLSSDVRSELL